MRFFTFGLLALSALSLSAQTPDKIRLVMPKGNGSILVPLGSGFELKQVALYDGGTRADIFLENNKTGMAVSYLLIPTDQYTDTTEKCLNAVLSGVVEGALAKATLKDKRSELRTLPNRQQIAVGSYIIEKSLGLKVNQKNVFGFFVSGSTCGEIHLSKTSPTPADDALFNAALDSFDFDPAYVPQAADYSALAKILVEKFHDNAAAKAYSTAANSQSPGSAPPPSSENQKIGLNFAMASHSGYLHMDAPNYDVTELSAKPNGKEFGIRADNKIDMTQVLGFLYLPDNKPDDSVSCRDRQLQEEEKQGYRQIISRREMTSATGVPIAIVEYDQSKKPAPYSRVIRGFVARHGVCADIEIMGKAGISPDLANNLFATIQFDPDREPDFTAKFAYVTVLFLHNAYSAAAPLYASMIPSASSTDDPTKWRRVLTDQASMSYGMSGDLAHSREVNQAAIAKDPDYPLYYYNLACADAEEGHADVARNHLEQAFARKSNTLPGEKMPDPSTDDSFLKLKTNKEFWNFVQSLPKQ